MVVLLVIVKKLTLADLIKNILLEISTLAVTLPVKIKLDDKDVEFKTYDAVVAYDAVPLKLP